MNTAASSDAPNFNTTAFDSTQGTVAALTRWATEADPVAATQKARAGFLARFERQVDPDGTMPADEREKRARRLMRAHMIQLARKSRTKRTTRLGVAP